MTAADQRETDDEYRLVLSILRALPSRYRHLIARELEGWSYRDIAASEGMSVESVRSVLRRARASFRRAYLEMTAGSLEDTFYEEDEPVGDVRAAFARGAKGTTGRTVPGSQESVAVVPDART